MTHSKIEEIADLAMMMYEESPYKRETSRSDFIETLSQGVEIFVEYSEGKAVGFIIAMLGERHPVWGKVRYAVELAWFVHPDYRSKGIAIKLLETFENWATLHECDMIFNAAMHNDSFDQVKSMYEKRGYTQMEVAFMKELN